MKTISFLLVLMLVSCTNPNNVNKEEKEENLLPISTNSEEAKEQFKKARHLVQNGLNGNPIEHYQKAIQLDSTFVRMYNFISTYSPDDSIKRLNHQLAKKHKHLATKEEQMIVDATEFRMMNPEDKSEALMFELAKSCPSDKYLFHTISYLLFRKNPELAIKAGQKSIELDNSYASGYNILGYSYINNADYIKAEQAFDNYIKYAPNRGNPYDSKGDLMISLNRFKEALELKKKAYELDKTFDWIPKEMIEIKRLIDSLENN